MRQLSSYAYANARIRARLSRLLGSEALQRLLGAADVYEMFDMLKGTPYGGALQPLQAGELDLGEIEKQVTLHDIRLYRSAPPCFRAGSAPSSRSWWSDSR